MNKDKITIYTDGGSRGNPGIAGAGAVIFDSEGKKIAEISKSLGVKTNNWAEYEAIIIGLEKAKKFFGPKLKNMQVEVKLDSQLAQRQINGKYQIKEETLFPQFIKIWNMKVKDFPNISFTHIPREQNEEADKMANKAMDEQS